MKFINILTSVVLLLNVFTNLAFAKEKTIKFHKPETEAEKALDYILMVESGVIKNSTLRREDMFTKDFIEACTKKKDDVLNSQECKEECGKNNPPCGLACYFPDNCIDHGNGDPIDPSDYTGISCKTSYKDATKAIILDLGDSKEVIGKYARETSFIMKKQDNKWKIDGICCNVDYCIVNCKDRQ